MSHPIYYYETIPSTNAEAKRMIINGAREGVLVAKSQSAGRGRLGRSFFSENGIFMSVILSPEKIPFDMGFLTSAVAVAVCRAIGEQGFDTQIKWVNDIYLNGKKICGILAEAVSMNTEMLGYVIGIGINVGDSDFPEEIREIAAALPLNENGKQELFFRVIAHLDAVLQENPQRLLAYLKEKSAVLGKPIRFFGATDGEGIALDLDTNGGLIVALDNGELITLTGGEISIRLQK